MGLLLPLIEDQHGTQWKVEAHDPAKGHVNQLNRAGFEYVVLPRKTFITGELVREQSAEGLVRSIRMADCLTFLERIA